MVCRAGRQGLCACRLGRALGCGRLAQGLALGWGRLAHVCVGFV